MIKLSIIIPVYNCEKYIEKCVQNVLSTDENVEVILVNDGSTDSSGKVCDALAAKYNNITVLTQENAGCAAARNFGTQHATGEFVWYIDADDYVEQNAVSEILQVLETEDSIDLLTFNIRTVFQDHSIIQDRIKKKEYLGRKQALVNALYTEKMTYSACDKVFRRSFLGNAPFPSGIPMGEEQIAVSRLLSKVDRVLLLPKCYYNYVQRVSSASHFPGKKDSEKMKLLYKTYCTVSNELEESMPELKPAIDARLVFQETCIIGWMARTKTPDSILGKKISRNIRSSLLTYCKNNRVSTSYKLAAMLAAIHYRLVYFTYRIILRLRSTSNLAE